VHGSRAIQTALSGKENKITALFSSAWQPSVFALHKSCEIGGVILDDGQWFNIGSRSEYLKVHRPFPKSAGTGLRESLDISNMIAHDSLKSPVCPCVSVTLPASS